MSEVERVVHEGVVVGSDDERVERLCQAFIEFTTEYDWAEGGRYSLPSYLRDALKNWAWSFVQWDRQNPR